MTPNSFHSSIRKAIADENLQTALDKNAEQRLIGRATAYTSLTGDLQVLRQQAHNIRADVIESHEYYLQEFIAKAQGNGFTIHRAADAAQARRIVLEIARKA